jgi:ATP-dependent helicase YprA (DUF1998 family)
MKRCGYIPTPAPGPGAMMGYANPSRSAFWMEREEMESGRRARRLRVMVFTSAAEIGLDSLELETCVNQGVCSHVRRLKKASDVVRQKEKSVEVRRLFVTYASAAMLGMSRS